jgi:sulfite reductase (NADPH) hemoprotein beta-component
MSIEGAADVTSPVLDRSHDLSQPLDKLNPDESLKAGSDHLRGTIQESLLDQITGSVSGTDTKPMKFHGIYQQDDRDIRDERRRQKLEPAYQFMIRVRLAGGVCTPDQWLTLDDLARAYGNETLRLTTRQTFQFHWVLKENLKPTIQGLHATLLDTIAACGDDSRGVMASANPHVSALHAQVHALSKRTSDHIIPRMRAYHEIWYGEARVASSEPEEPFYGRTYLPRKFKVGFVVPPYNDIDVYAQDLGFIAIEGPNGLEGFNVAIGGGMGRTDQAPATYPRVADVIGFIPVENVLATADAVMGVQHDYGNRVDRSHARFKYTIDDKGLDWIKAEIEARLGFAFEPARPYRFDSNRDALGWVEGADGRWHFTPFIENDRIINRPECALMDGLRAIARTHRGTFRITPNQNVVLADIEPQRRSEIDALIDEYGIGNLDRSGLRLNSMACVAFRPAASRWPKASDTCPRW